MTAILLAFAIGHLKEAGLLGIRTNAEKLAVLAVLNVVECVAHGAPGSRSATPRSAVRSTR
jgi:hypothetical protein